MNVMQRKLNVRNITLHLYEVYKDNNEQMLLHSED